MRPVGVVSKKLIGDLTTPVAIATNAALAAR